jgi:prevent-host-death family protein
LDWEAGMLDIDPRIKAWGISKLRLLTGATLRAVIAEGGLIIVQVHTEPVAVVVGYKQYLEMQEERKRRNRDGGESKTA